MLIRNTMPEDFDAVMSLYAGAREFMRRNGNPTQWGETHPAPELVRQDIENGTGFVCTGEDNSLLAAFYFSMEEEPSYCAILPDPPFPGRWLNDKPYGVVHRIASVPGRGAGEFCLRWCFEQCGNVRIDTHRANIPMRRLLAKLGYTQCGIITIDGWGDRIAFQ
ncbi:MAG: N-acetyltransferase, partial [Spirochaetaceae bacterium]|nr:N-acetyltransferase [Spirochaetaceae bacterium]